MSTVADCQEAKRQFGAKLRKKRSDMINLKAVKDKLKKVVILPRAKDIMARALKFAHENPNVLIMVIDPKKDDIIAAYNRHYSIVNVRSKILNLKVHILKEILRNKNTHKNINKILKVMDGFLWNLAYKIRKADKTKLNNK